jgi:hypothetical protein
MKDSNTDKLIAYLTLFSGLTLSIVAEYYSIVGLTAIFSASAIPVIIMGIAIGLGKIAGTLWLKQNWNIAPFSIKVYLSIAVLVLMFITSMGIFGFLSNAHSNQSLVSGEAIAKLDVYDDKIKTANENIEANRAALKQLDEAVDQTMGRSTSEQGARRAVAVRKSQQEERNRLLTEIQTYQTTIAKLREERAPFATEVRKLESEVGPIKYIAAFFYDSTDTAILERAVTWVILLFIPVFDPLAIILLISSQISFQKLREKAAAEVAVDPIKEELVDYKSSTYEPDNGPLTEQQLEQIKKHAGTTNKEVDPVELWNKMLSAVGGDANSQSQSAVKPYVWQTTVYPPVSEQSSEGYVQNEEQSKSGLWKDITSATQISEKDYHDAIERNIDEMVENVRKGILPFYKVPYEIQDQVKQKLQNGKQDNFDNTP